MFFMLLILSQINNIKSQKDEHQKKTIYTA